jgi:hypothetical protein
MQGTKTEFLLLGDDFNFVIFKESKNFSEKMFTHRKVDQSFPFQV